MELAEVMALGRKEQGSLANLERRLSNDEPEALGTKVRNEFGDSSSLDFNMEVIKSESKWMLLKCTLQKFVLDSDSELSYDQFCKLIFQIQKWMEGFS